MKRIRLREIAHARAGDKGDVLSIAVIPYDEKNFNLLKEKLTPKAVREQFKGIVKGEIKRYDLENLKAFNFVFYDALDGGITSSLRLDKHGKTLSFILLDMEIEI